MKSNGNPQETLPVIRTRSGKLISYEPEHDLLMVESENGGACIVIDLSNDKVTIRANGDIDLASNQKIRLSAKEGVEIRTEGDAELIAGGETIIRGKMVRIN